MKDATVIFDLDGTMIDTAPDLIAATNHTLGEYGMSAVPERVIQPAVGYGAKAMILAAMKEHARTPDPEALDTMTEQFVDYYRQNIAVASRPFPGFEEALAALGERGFLLGVCTNKREELARKLLAELKLDGHFHALTGSDTFPFRKPDGRHILETIALAGGHPSRAVMIGDSGADAGAARDASVPFIAVSFGYGESPVEILEPDAVIHSYSELMPAVLSLIPA